MGKTSKRENRAVSRKTVFLKEEGTLGKLRKVKGNFMC